MENLIVASSTIPENVSKDFTIAPVDDRTATYVNIRAHRDDRVTRAFSSPPLSTLDKLYHSISGRDIFYFRFYKSCGSILCARKSENEIEKDGKRWKERFRFILCCGVKWSIGTSSRGEKIEIKVDR